MRNDECEMRNNWDITERTKCFALRIIRLYSSLPKSTQAQVIGKQLLRSGTSVGAHIREGKRSRSDAEMISKIEVAQQELEETIYWFELLVGSNLVEADRLTGLAQEANELLAILVSSSRTIKQRKRGSVRSEC
ncbi:four helix bundle protein [Microbulbifer donghaiensis]|uniref:Four helix bundle protein n=1 Tax=Microbulbifer donghaiensis TaxID=494016 RepID=A0A1M5I688_9GAMM|nr:four helix bundle protein [Microbulbifer donghaiensis]SHG23886.1 four helix bundle protein [Microbulbifer donghaiensis]